jgi:hypothetical protein
MLADAGRTFCTSMDLRTSLAGGRPTFAVGRLRPVCRAASGQAADRCGRGCRRWRLRADFLLAIWSWRRGTRGSGCLSTAPADRGRGRACYGCPAGAVLRGGRMSADRRSCPRRRREGRGSDQPARAGRRGDCGRGSTCREDRAQRPLAIAATNRVLTESADWAAAEAFAQQRDQLAAP